MPKTKITYSDIIFDNSDIGKKSRIANSITKQPIPIRFSIYRQFWTNYLFGHFIDNSDIIRTSVIIKKYNKPLLLYRV